MIFEEDEENEESREPTDDEQESDSNFGSMNSYLSYGGMAQELKPADINLVGKVEGQGKRK